MNDSGMVMIPIKRYEELIKTETRVNTLVERFERETYLAREEILFAIGTDLSMKLAAKLFEERSMKCQQNTTVETE